MKECKITFGWVIRTGRKNLELSQRELCSLINKQFSIAVDWKDLSKIENDRINIQTVELDVFVDCVTEIFELDRDWVQQIREQTEIQILDLSQAIFPVYFEQTETTIDF